MFSLDANYTTLNFFQAFHFEQDEKKNNLEDHK